MMAKVRELKLHIMFGFLVVILLLVQAVPAMAQSSHSADHIVINEVDINPPGDDSKLVSEWVELYNPTNKTVDLGGWSIAATTGTKTTYKIAEGMKLKSGGYLTFAHGPLWFPDTSSLVQLKNKNATVIDTTPILRDIENNLKSWQRITDGLDTDSSADWIFRTSNAGSSNGKISSTTGAESLSIKISTDKPVYIFGDLVKISGQVSKKVTVPHQLYTPQSIHLTITGPEDFEKTFSLYPDRMNMFKSEMKTDKVLKIPEGDYKAVVEYGGVTTETTFSIFEKAFVPPEKVASAVISISMDKSAYIPGETAVLSANTSKIIPFSGMKFQVFDPDKKQIYDGSLYPDTKGKFSTTFFITSVKPVFGKYTVVATYDKDTTTTSYELVQDIKEDTLISLTSDKKAYGLGDTVIISGRLNKVISPTLDIEIVQPFLSKGVTSTFIIKDLLRLKDFGGDGTFKYEFKVPNSNERLGDYKVKVNAKSVGSAEYSFKVVENPNEFVEVVSKPLSISTDKDSYNIGDQLIISGKVMKPKDVGRQIVQISITKADGTPIISKAGGKATTGKNNEATYSFTGIPDASGNFEIKSDIPRTAFEKGKYLIKAKDGENTATTSFTVTDTLDLSSGVKIVASTDKEVYGAGEQVKLTGGVSTFTAQTSYTITLTDPDGKTTKTGVTLDKGQFSWTWTIRERAVVYGIYKITVSSDSDKTNVFFKVSKDPKSETTLPPIIVETDKDVYQSGDTVIITGSVLKKERGTEGLVIHTKPEITIKTESYKEVSKAFPDLTEDGRFTTSLKLVPVAFKTGQYKVTAKYYDTKAQTVFKVANKFNVGVDTPLVLLMTTDKEKYLPGETVKISGKTSKIISVFDVDVKISKDDKLISGTTVRFDPTGSFNYNYVIPQNANLGNYTVKADTDFDTTTALYEVVNELPPEPVTQPVEEPTTGTTAPTSEMPTPTVTHKKITDTINRISGSSIPITVKTKNIEEKNYVPTLLEGTLRVNAGDESKVNIKVIADDGTCLIGQDNNCKVTKSTREGSSLYKIVKVGDTNLKIRYSGNSAILEKFTILPEDPSGAIPEGNWHVEIIKDKQISRFYYKISYTSVE
jgi:hypothetical protein